MFTWANSDEYGDGNLAIRLLPNTIGIDVDHYGNKRGADTFAEAEKRWGKTPATYRSTSRTDGKSGIRLYRIPEGVKLKEKIGFPELGLGGIEICQHHHRYVVSWPSIHDKSGETYRWYAEINGKVMDQPPALADIPDLPAEWLEALTETEHNGTEIPSDSRADVQSCMTEGEMSHRVLHKLGQALAELFGPNCRHDAMRDSALGLLRCGKNGAPGVKQALSALCEAFVNKVGPDRPGGEDEARDEFRKFIYRKLNDTWVIRDEVATRLADTSYDDDENDSRGTDQRDAGGKQPIGETKAPAAQPVSLRTRFGCRPVPIAADAGSRCG